jgi:hypothetical protein
MSIALQRLIFELNHSLSIALQLALVAMMLLRQLHRQLPVFLAYLIVDIISSAVTLVFVFQDNQHAGWYVLWTGDLICLVMEFVIIYNIFVKALATYSGIRQFARIVMFSAATILVAVSGFVAFCFHDVAYSDALLTVLLVLERSVRLVQLGLILTFFAVSKYLHLRWRNFIFGVALGFGFDALTFLTGNVIRDYYGKLVTGTVGALQGTWYCMAAAIWLFYALQPDVANIPIVTLPSHELEKWDLALSRLLSHTTSSSIPGGGD